MFHLSFKHSFFKPPRLVWGAPPELPPSGGGEKGKEAGEKSKEKAEKAVKKAKTESGELKEKVEAVRQTLELLQNRRNEIEAFIKRNSEYESGDWVKWNTDLLMALGIASRGKEGNLKIVKGLQKILFEHLGLTGDRAAVVDGKMGPYTMAALIAYLKLDIPETYHTQSDYTGGSEPLKGMEGVEKLGAALRKSDVDKDIEKMLTIPKKEELFLAYEGALTDDINQLSETIGTLEGQAKDLFDENLERVIVANEGNFDTQTAEGWRRAFKIAGLKDYEIEGMGLKSEAAPVGVETKAEVVTESAAPTKPEGLEPSSPKVERTEKASVNFDEALTKAIAKEVLDDFSNGSQALYDEIKVERGGVEGILSRHPEAHYSFYNYILPKPLREAVSNYKDAYLEWEPFKDKTSGFEVQLTAKREAFEKLSEATKKYYDNLEKLTRLYDEKGNKIGNAFDQKYQKEVLELGRRYHLPENTSADHLASLREKADRFSTVQTYLSSPIMSLEPVKSKDVLIQLLEGDTPGEKAENFKKMQEKMGIDEDALVDAYNSRIYSVNIFNFREKTKQLARMIRKEQEHEMNEIKNKSLEELMSLS